MNVHDPNAHPMAPMTDEQAAAHADRLIREAYQPTYYRDDSPLPLVGSTPPVPQQGRPPMSQQATDASTLMLAGAGSVSMVSVSAGVLMYLSQYADPVVCGIVLGAPTVTVLALVRLVRQAKKTVQAAPPVIHQHYEGTVHQDHSSYNTQTRGMFARTRNDVRK
ncbi:hypothetical protein ACIGW7_39995 [Streptomyces sp. NPDC053253]|uniref:hypothetical protein n=1 Tax=Streptomyces sp. NPDC053253 TaxID=3365699 RepID=UPI0037D626BE